MQEVGVGVGGVALDEDVAALGHDLLDRAGLHAPHLDVVEGDVERAGVLDQLVVTDDRHAVVDRIVDRRPDGRRVHGQDQDDVGALVDELLDVRNLFLGRPCSVGLDVLGAGLFEHGLDGGFVPERPSLFLELPPAHADDRLVSLCSDRADRRKHPCRGDGQGKK